MKIETDCMDASMIFESESVYSLYIVTDKINNNNNDKIIFYLISNIATT